MTDVTLSSTHQIVEGSVREIEPTRLLLASPPSVAHFPSSSPPGCVGLNPVGSVRSPFLQLLALALLLPHARSAGADEVGPRAEYIVGGEPVSPGDEHGTVGLLLLGSEGDAEQLRPATMLDYLRCSGVLIAPSVVVTAAHCVDACEDLPLCEDGAGGCTGASRAP